MALYPSGLRGRSAKPLFVGSNPTGASSIHLTKMYFVYVLLSEKDNKRYVGFTDNIERRLSEHDSGLVKSTKHRRPLKLIYSENFTHKNEAMRREIFFKTHTGRNFLDFIGK